MRILIAGDRHWNCIRLATAVLGRLRARYGDDITIVHGDANGVDTCFGIAARAAGIRTEYHAARWTELGRRAGPVRNAEMIESGIDLVLAFHRNILGSRGTLDCCQRAIMEGIPVWLIDSDQADGKCPRPRRIDCLLRKPPTPTADIPRAEQS